jgi:hypothetical protein
MLLTNVFTSRCVGINFSKINSLTITNLNFRTIKISIDIRDNNAEKRCFEMLRNYVDPEDKVFVILPDQKHYIPVILSMVAGITNRLPYIVYFDIRNDPNFLTPYCKSLELMKWQSSEATELEIDYGFISV